MGIYSTFRRAAKGGGRNRRELKEDLASGVAGGIADGFEVFDHLRGDAEPLFEKLIGNPPEILRAERERLGVKLGIVNRQGELQVVVVGAGEALLDVRIDTMGIPKLVDPGSVV